MGVSPSRVQVLHGDTGLVPFGRGTAASRGTVAGASALYMALQDARQKLAQIASHLLQCPADEIIFEQDMVYGSTAPDRALIFSEVASAAHSEERLPPNVAVGLDFDATYTLPSPPFGFAAHVAVVEVERDTGATKILHYAAVHDCGRIINPKLVEGQIHGGIAQGLGQALTEGILYSLEGQPLTSSLMDYALPFADEFPEPLLETFETPSPLNPLGVKGIGELPTVAAPVAVAKRRYERPSRGGSAPHRHSPDT